MDQPTNIHHLPLKEGVKAVLENANFVVTPVPSNRNSPAADLIALGGENQEEWVVRCVADSSAFSVDEMNSTIEYAASISADKILLVGESEFNLSIKAGVVGRPIAFTEGVPYHDALERLPDDKKLELISRAANEPKAPPQPQLTKEPAQELQPSESGTTPKCEKPSAKATLIKLVRYHFDNFMSKGIGSMLIGLTVTFLASFGLIVLVRLACFGLFGWRGQYMLGQEGAAHLGENEFLDQSILHHIYLTFLQMTDAGNMAQDIGAHPGYKISAILSGVVGLVLLSALVGLITTWLINRMEKLRKGHSVVVESGHTLILGWQPNRVLEILRELIEANESEKNAAVCILAEEDKETMDEFLARNLPLKERLTTRVVTRAGSISSILDLNVASVEACKSVIVLASCNQSASEKERQSSDARTIKAILAVDSCDWVSPDEEEIETLNIVAEIFDPSHEAIISRSVKHQVTVVYAWEILAKIIVQTSRSVGLSVAYSELLSFQGCEMYFHNADWNGVTFGKLQYHFPDGVPIGVRGEDGIIINPSIDRPMMAGEDILIIADDDSTIELSAAPVALPVTALFAESRISQNVENILIIGWNRMSPIIIEQYSDYILDGSTITILVEESTSLIRSAIDDLGRKNSGLDIELVEGDAFQVDALRAIKPSRMDNIIILNKGGDTGDAEKTDSETILILLMLRNIFEESGDTNHPKLIAEVADSKNQSLVSNSGVRDFIISNRFVSMLLAQISEEADVKMVYDDLFEDDGSEIYLKPLSLYLPETAYSQTFTFADCMHLAQQREEVCIGVKISELETDESENFGVELIPEKNKQFTLSPNDCLVVVAEDET